ncbi:high affinity cationic amino acid transporter 1-like isoform X2 [Mya arenaria]|uniref:high affinity cationic amino acid transporter 1-like isoform X2 n=1 Tax=Mya arenaria TaxID=6604 RepID=UPI0022E2B4A7|nr:high affinity cationic amino acid transporter 1-like isoform X2 [Mya arenaria]XP_052819611.1 high affinity cationic amino acid transporter 1-like isoform X2 [Mya arenaria]
MGLLHKLTRRKFISADTVESTQLARCLNTVDLTALGVGSTLGAGIYVVAGQVAKQTSGPSVFLSFLIAAMASILAGLCYAEFGARVPRTGSAYVYSYVTIGELMAFVIGWNLILEYVIGTASVARAWSSYFDSLVNNKIQDYFKENIPMNLNGLSPYPDFFALGITLLLTVILAVGVKESSRFNNLFTVVNLLVVTYIIICGAFKADSANWNIDPKQVKDFNSTDVGSGGFMPFGFSGMFSGAATCFYAFVGFDAIATTGEEVKNPQKAIPISIVISLLTCFVAYSGISVVITLMCPYYLLDGNAPLPAVFDRVGWHVARYIIAVGAVCGLSTSLLGAMFPLPRVIYAISSDGLLFKGLATVSERFKTPLLATLLSGLFAGLMAMLFDLKELVDMMSIGTLLAYTLVAVSVLILRYKEHNIGEATHSYSAYTKVPQNDTEADLGGAESHSDKQRLLQMETEQSILSTLFNYRNKDPSALTEKVAAYNVTIFCFVCIGFSVFLKYEENNIGAGKVFPVIVTAVFTLILLVLIVSIGCQPQNKAKLSFKVPWVPVLPGISVFVNIFLMLRLPEATWIRFAVWMVLGFLIYFCYGIWHSAESSCHDNLALATLKPKPTADVDELFDDDDWDTETELETKAFLEHDYR